MTGRRTAAVLIASVLAVAALAWAGGAGPYRAVGNADPGAWVAVGTPVLRLLAYLAASGCLGSLAFACATRPRPGGGIGAQGYRELRVAGWMALVWAGAAAAEVPLSAADTAGLRLPDVLAHLPGLVVAMETPRAWLVVAVVALVVALGCRATLRWSPVPGLTALAAFGLVPPVMTGHGSADLGHDLALGALVLHVPAAALWAGLLLVVLRRRMRPGEPQLRWYRRCATGCGLVVAGTGVLLGLVLDPGGGFGSGYGLLLVAKVVLGIAMVAVALAGRRRGRPVAEFGLLAAAFVVSADLTHTPVPGFFGRATSTAEALLGYDLGGPPTLLRLLTDWRIDLVWAPVALVAAAGYLLGARRAGDWPWPRTTAWLSGCLLLLITTSSGLGRYAAGMFSLHLTVHMLLSMLVPVLLVLSEPEALLRRRFPALGGRLDLIRAGAPARLLSQPVVVLALFAGSPFLLYATPLFDAAVRFHWAHLLIDAWFLAVGLLFARLVLGGSLPNLARLGLVLAAMPADVVFAAYLMTTPRVLGNGPAAAQMYQALHLPWVPDLLADQRLGGIAALVIGEVALLVVLGALLLYWHDRDDDVAVYEENDEQWRRSTATR